MSDHVGAVAWTDPRTRRAWRRSFSFGGLFLLAGFALLAAFSTYVSAIDSDAAALQADGVRTTATVLADPPYSRTGEVRVPIRFDIDGRSYVEPFNVSNQPFEKGDTLTVYVDRSNPAHFATDDGANEQPWAVMLACAALVLGPLVIFCGFVRFARLVKVRKVLRSASWVTRSAAVLDMDTAWAKGVRFVVYRDTSPVEVVRMPWNLLGRGIEADAAVDLLTATDQRGRSVVAAPGDPVGRISGVVREGRRREKVLRMFEAQEASVVP